MNESTSGFQEIEHTADWALHVWAPDLASLLVKAAEGMYALSQVRLEEGKTTRRRIELEAQDAESLLVAFLEELLFFGEQEDVGFNRFEVNVEGRYALTAGVEGGKIASRKKEIKAVTFHHLAIREGDEGFEVDVVFDV